MRIGELARTADVSVETVRYYQRLRLLATPRKPYSGFRTYTETDLAHLRFIKRAQQLGFSLEEIAGLIRLSSADCAGVQKLARHKQALVRAKIADLTRIAEVLDSVLRQCARRKPHEGCPIIESLSDPAKSRA